MKKVLQVSCCTLMIAYAVMGSNGVNARPLLLNDIDPSRIFSESQISLEIVNIENSKLSLQKPTQLNDFQYEYLLHHKIKHINAADLSSSEHAELKALSSYQSKTYRVHEEGPLPIKIFDIASLAKSKLFQYEVGQQEKYLYEQLTNNVNAFLNQDFNNPLTFLAAQKVISNVSDQQAKAIGDSMITKSVLDKNQAVLLGQLGSIIVQPAYFKKALTSLTDGAEGHKILENMNLMLEATDSIVIFEELIQDKSYLASQALLYYSKLPSYMHNSNMLFNLLSDEKLGSSAAFVISQNLSANNLAQTLNIISNNQSSRVQVANALMTLKSAQSITANNAIKDLLQNNKIPYVDMAKEVSQWAL
ncbi:MAG: hypothetical protein HWD86_08990 [Kangiellaceae bacterium]|nr:hypothetical protein [Kangiellaceae bacterium]